MSIELYLYCKETLECIEAVGTTGDKPHSRMKPNAMGAFLLYHYAIAKSYQFELVMLESISQDRSVFTSLKDVDDERESIGGFSGYKPPVLIWKDTNYHELLGRLPAISADLVDIESRVGCWKRVMAGN